MRILLLNQYFPPDTSATANMASLVVESIAEGNEVVVIAGRPSYAPHERHPYYILRRENAYGATIERVGTTSFHRSSLPRRLANFISYLLLALIRAAIIRPKPDMIIAMTDPPLICVVAALVSILRRCRFVYNIRDLHPDMAVAAGVVKPGFLVSLWGSLHAWALKRATLVIVLGDDMRKRILVKGVPPSRIEVVRDGAPPAESAVEPNHPVTREIRGRHEFVVVHAGNLGYAGRWEILIEAAHILEADDVGFVFIGEGAQRPALEKLANGLDNVRFLPFYASGDVSRVLGSADLHIVAVKRGLEGLVVPSKLYPILMAGRPVLAVAPPESDVAKIVRDRGCGFVADPDDPADVAAAVQQARAEPRLLAEMAERAKETGMSFRQQDQLDRFSHLVESFANGR